MRRESEPETDSAARLSQRVPWVVTSVRALDDHRLHVRFRDGTEGDVDVSRLILSAGAGVFAVLRDPLLFQSVRVHDGAVTWPGELDLAPDAMYDEIKANGRWVIEPRG